MRSSTETAPAPVSPRQLLEDLVVKLAVGLGAGFMAWHISAIVMYNAPTNAIRLSLTPLLTGYISPVLDQAWNFFAPNPVDRDTEALYRVRYRGSGGRLVVTTWVSMTKTMNATVNYNWFSPYMLVRSTVIGSLQGFSEARFHYRHAGTGNETATLQDQTFDVIALERTAMALAAQSVPPARPYEIQMTAVASQYPRFSHRRQAHDGQSAVHTVYVTLPWIKGQNVSGFEE